MAAHLPRRGEAADRGLKLTVLGARGSMAVSERGREIFGGATSCYMVQTGEDCVFLDAGSGLLAAPIDFPNPPLILISHLHLDHLLGLGMYRRLLLKGVKTRLCLPEEDPDTAWRKLERLYSPPFWPLSIKNYTGDAEMIPARFPMQYGALYIESMEGSHPGGCLIFKISSGGKSMVYVTDYEPTPFGFRALADFAKGTDLLLYDGQYEMGEYESRKGFGHSTVEKGLELMELCGAKQMRLIHHDPSSTDKELLARELLIRRSGVRFARQGEVIEL